MGIFDNFGDVVSDTYKSVTKASGKLIEEGKLKLLIMDNESEMKTIFETIGKDYCENYFKGQLLDNGKYENEFDELKRMQLENDQAKEKLLELKSIKKCPSCEKEIRINDVYCHFCGTKQPEPEKQEDLNVDVEVAEEEQEPEQEKIEDIKCKSCGLDIKTDDEYCPFCGAKNE